MIIVAECNRKYNDLIEYDPIITFPKIPNSVKELITIGIRIDEHQFQFFLFRQDGFYSKNT
jgi:hypothetical protein